MQAYRHTSSLRLSFTGSRIEHGVQTELQTECIIT
jgi:hypothetical protein